MAAQNWRKWVAVTAIGFFLQAMPAHAADPTTKPKPAAPNTKSLAAMNAAVADLLKEAKAVYAEKPAADAKPRPTADYFPSDAPPDGITPAAIMAAIERSLDRDARIDCYIKWQLLSGMPAEFPKELLPRAMILYRRATEPFDHPGLNHSKLSAAIYRIGVMNKEAAPKIKDDYDTVLAARAAENEPILRFRDSLFSHLPSNAETFYAGMQDLAVRAKHGLPSQPMWDQLAASIKTWSTVDTQDPRQLNALIKAMTDLKQLVGDQRYQAYIGIDYHEQGNPLGLAWTPQAPVDGQSIQNLIDSIKTDARANTGGGLNFKDDKK
jgi:hypothetical protein